MLYIFNIKEINMKLRRLLKYLCTEIMIITFMIGLSYLSYMCLQYGGVCAFFVYNSIMVIIISSCVYKYAKTILTRYIEDYYN